jgi:hypothetical protein
VGVTISHNNHRLFVGNIPKNRDGHQLYQDFDKFARKLLGNESIHNQVPPSKKKKEKENKITHSPVPSTSLEHTDQPPPQ